MVYGLGKVYFPCDNGIHICGVVKGSFTTEFNKELNPIEARIVFETIKQEFNYDIREEFDYYYANSAEDSCVIDLIEDGINTEDFAIKATHLRRVKKAINKICSKNYQEK